MPFTMYHFGPSGFLGLLFRKWIDIPVFVLANVITDIEVLFAPSWFPHRHWHFHTFLIGAVVGAVWALSVYPFRGLVKRIMRAIYIPYETGLRKMIISGILGVWLHTLIDSAYHYDVQPFWPYTKNPIWGQITRVYGKPTPMQIEFICLVFLFLAVILYAIVAVSFGKARKTKLNRS